VSIKLALLTEIIAPYRIPVFNALARRDGIQLHVIFLAETDPTQRDWLVYKNEIEFSYEVLPAWRRRFGPWRVLLNWGMWTALEHFQPDSILCGGYNHLAFWEALAWAKWRKVAFSAWVESTNQDSRALGTLKVFLKRQFVHGCNSFAVPGKSSLDYVRSLGAPAERIYMAPNAVDTHRFAELARAARERGMECRADLGMPRKYFLFVGRLIREKGVFQLLEAYRRLDPAIRKEMSLVFVGDGPAKDELLSQAGDVELGHVAFPGFAQRDRLAAFYGLAELLVFPTLSDPWGLVVNEAMACSLPIIATEVAGCAADLVRHGENGYVVPPNNVLKLAEAMTAFASAPDLRSTMGACSARIIEDYSPEMCAAGLAEAAGEQLRVSQ
jgi:glycosyltransferase involved in cell wall biosynthesis